MSESVHGLRVVTKSNSFMVKNIDLLLIDFVSHKFVTKLYSYFFTDTIIVTLDLENLMLENIQS